MAVQSLLFLLSLAVSTRSWPQLPSVNSADPASIPFSPRSLPSVDEVESPGTLNIPVSRRELPAGDELDKTSFVLPVGLKRDSPGTLTLPIIHAPKPGLVGRDLEVQLENRSDVAYYAQLYIGTPPQKVYAQLDTGSFELWVNPDCASLASSSDRKFCQAVGQYDPGDSSTGQPTKESKTLKYGLGKADITYYVDNVGFSEGTELKSVKFGVADGGTEDQFAGVLGVGYGEGVNTKYRNVVDEMAEQRVVAAKAFSVALGSKDDGGGVAIFGGVDTAKFKGQLARLPIIPAKDSPDGAARYWVQMDSVSHSTPGSKTKTWDGTKMPVFLDTGATLTLLPPNVVAAMAADFGSDGKDDAGFYAVDCALVDKPGTVDFSFDGVTVKVPYKEIIRHFHNSGSSSCYLGITPSDEFTLLGDTFLRSAYVVFDLESDTVFMAQYKNCGSDVSSIKSSSDLKRLEGSCGGGDEASIEAISSTAVSSAASTTSEGLLEMTEEATTSSVDSKTASTATTITTSSKPEETRSGRTGSDSSESGNESGADGGDSGDNNAATRLQAWLGVSAGCIAVMAMV